MINPPSESGLVPETLADMPSDIAASVVTGLHARFVRMLKARFLPELRRLCEEGHELSDCAVCIMEYNSGVFPEDAKVAGADGNVLGPDGKPARGPDGKFLWPEQGVRTRTRTYWKEYLLQYKNDAGECLYQGVIDKLGELPPADARGHEGYWTIVFYAGEVTISATHYPTDQPLMKWEIAAQIADGVAPNPLYVPPVRAPVALPGDLADADAP